MAQVLTHYRLKPDARHRLRCPFHEDRTPSMQVYPATNTAYCFSGNCATHGTSLDVIDFVMRKEGCTKREALEKCKALIGQVPSADVRRKAPSNRELASKASRSAVLLKAWQYMRNAVGSSPTARGYLEGRGIDYKMLRVRGLDVGYQGGQMHHGQRAEQELIEGLLGVGLLKEVVGGRNNRSGGPAYRTFGHKCVAFALRDESGQVAGLYFRSTAGGEAKTGRHYYLRDRRGLWPRWPAVKGTRLQPVSVRREHPHSGDRH